MDYVAAPSASDAHFASPAEALPGAAFRPINYLGSKLRVLNEIRLAVAQLTRKTGRVADLFSGSTVVAQALADDGHAVTAVDTQAYAVTLANACLCIGRRPREECNADAVLNYPLPDQTAERFDLWAPYVREEECALQASDADWLRDLYARLPLAWRNEGTALGASLRGERVAEQRTIEPLITAIYAGSYFGIAQALEIDLLRHNLNSMSAANLLSSWQQQALLASILSAASATVHSAGKHFAQPLTAATSANISFRSTRLLQDRRLSLAERFLNASVVINARPATYDSRHDAVLGEAEHFSQRGLADIDVIYMDPPYTAQQYSRFYHILETITIYQVPSLFGATGRLTSGLYPANRYKSRFSSKKSAKPAMLTLLKAARDSGTSAIISYSASDPRSDGNARMISLNEILDMCVTLYGRTNVQSQRLLHRYRQFNSEERANTQRNDPEMLIVCKID